MPRVPIFMLFLSHYLLALLNVSSNFHWGHRHYRLCYIRFIRKMNDKKGIEGQEETRKAFEFMLNFVGMLLF